MIQAKYKLRKMNFLESFRLYKRLNTNRKYIFCWHKEAKIYCFFNYENLESIKQQEKIEVIHYNEKENIQDS